MIKLLKIYFAIIFLSLIDISGCKSSNKIYMYSPDESQVITAIIEYDTIYIIAGEHREVPHTGYVKIDWSKRDITETLNVCWKNGNDKYDWYVVLKNATIVDNSLDTSIYMISTSLPTDINGLPTEIKFRSINCSTVNLIECKNSPPSSTIVRCLN